MTLSATSASSMWPVCLSVKSPALSFFVLWATHSSCQHERGCGDETPDGVDVMYFFSDGKGGRGTGAIRKRPAKSLKLLDT